MITANIQLLLPPLPLSFPPEPLPLCPTQTLTYTPFQKTATITEDTYSYSIIYGTDHQRKKTVLKNNNNITETKIYSGRYEKLTTPTGTKELHYIPTPSGTVAAHIKTNGASGTTYFLLKDHLGSILKVINAAGSTIEEHSYDAWGNHRLPSDWSLTDFSSTLGIRGYTGHEMLPHFQLINMNGRMYDPVIGRVLAPDNLVGDAFNAQAFNRYSYALNNPLKFIDPTGEKWKWWQWTLLGVGLSDPATASVTIGTTGAGIAGIASSAGVIGCVTTALNAPIMIAAGWIFNNYDGKNAVRNSWRITYGALVTDPNKDIWGRTWEFSSRFTWEALQTVVGYTYTQGRNLCGRVDRVDYLGGATFATQENMDKRDGVSLGNYLNINIKDEITGSFEDRVKIDPLFMHEYGHIKDSKIFGLSYIVAIGLFSACGAEWTEIRANKHAKTYFEHYYDVDWNGYSPYYTGGEWRTITDENGNTSKYWYDYTIEDYYPTH